jgi:hypothetical protein
MGKEKFTYKSKCDVFKKTNAVDDIGYKNKMMIVFIRSKVSQHFLAWLFFLRHILKNPSEEGDKSRKDFNFKHNVQQYDFMSILDQKFKMEKKRKNQKNVNSQMFHSWITWITEFHTIIFKDDLFSVDLIGGDIKVFVRDPSTITTAKVLAKKNFGFFEWMDSCKIASLVKMGFNSTYTAADGTMAILYGGLGCLFNHTCCKNALSLCDCKGSAYLKLVFYGETDEEEELAVASDSIGIQKFEVLKTKYLKEMLKNNEFKICYNKKVDELDFVCTCAVCVLKK